MGPYTARFEQVFAEYIGVKYAFATTSGTTALHLALVALGIGPGDEVLVPTLSFVATANAVAYTGATPVFVDVDSESWNIDTPHAARLVTERTRAIIPVHLYGLPADMRAIRDVARVCNLHIIEDAAEALGSAINGRKVGSFGDVACFSFYGNKTITTGEGGMITTDMHDIADAIHLLRGAAETAS
jgi:perosamine synthetase